MPDPVWSCSDSGRRDSHAEPPPGIPVAPRASRAFQNASKLLSSGNLSKSHGIQLEKTALKNKEERKLSSEVNRLLSTDPELPRPALSKPAAVPSTLLLTDPWQGSGGAGSAVTPGKPPGFCPLFPPRAKGLSLVCFQLQCSLLLHLLQEAQGCSIRHRQAAGPCTARWPPAAAGHLRTRLLYFRPHELILRPVPAPRASHLSTLAWMTKRLKILCSQQARQAAQGNLGPTSSACLGHRAQAAR